MLAAILTRTYLNMTNATKAVYRTLSYVFSLCFFISAASSLSAQYYWVGGSGNWTDYANHWATSSGGNTFHTSVPGSTDDVIFDANSFSQSGQTVTLDTSMSYCNSMDWTGVLHNPGLVGNGFSTIINIHGSLTLSPNANYDFGVVELESTGSGNTISCGGNHLGTFAFLRFNGIGGNWTLQDTLNAYYVQFYHGTLNSNGNTLNIDATFGLYGAGTKVLNLSNSSIHVSQWRTSGTNNTLNMGNSTIYANSFYGDQNADGPFNYHDLIMNEGGYIYDDCNFNDITLGNDGSIYNTVTIESGSTIDFQSLTINSKRSMPLDISASTTGMAATLSKSSGTVNVSYVVLQDIHASGGASFNASQSVDNGNNTGWNITAIVPLNYYWVGDGGNWSDYANHWATTSGGSSYHTDVPSQFDHVYFDASSFSMASQSVVVDSPYTCASIDFSSVANTPQFSASYGNPLTVFGSVDFSTNMTGSIYNLHLDGPGTGQTINQGAISIQNFAIYGSGNWTLTDNLDVANFNIYDDATFDSDGYTIDVNFTFRTYDKDVNVFLDTTHLLTRDFILGHRNINFNAGSSNIQVNRNFEGKGNSFHKLSMEGVSTIYDQNTFEFLEVLPGTDASFEADSVQTVNQGIILPGTASSPISLSSTTSGTQAIFSMSSGTVNGTFLILQDMNGTGGATYNAIESIDNGNNTGWNITALVPLDYYWVGDGGNWSDYANHWATTSGGSTFRLRVPGALDNVYFDVNSFTSSGQTVTIDDPQANFHDMDWTNVTNNPSLSGSNKTMNIYGSINLSSNMSFSIKDMYFYSDTVESITMGSGMYPGNSSYMYFDGNGEWTFQDSARARELNFSSGTINTGNNALHVNFALNFSGTDNKTLNLGSSTIFARSMKWNSASSDNLTINGGSSHIRFSSSLSLYGSGNNISVTLGDLSAVKETFQDHALVYYSYTADTVSIEPGKTIKLSSGTTLSVNQLVAAGTVNDSITIECVQSGQTGTISQASGTVNGQYLRLKDNSAVGGAVFNAYGSVNNGNVSGWIFNTSSQIISFGTIPDKYINDAPFTISATATSGLPVSFSIISGPASISGDTISLTGAVGTVTVEATQAGDINFNPAPPVSQSFMVTKVGQTISFIAIPNKAPNDPPFTISASASSGLPVSFSILSGPATIQDSTITLTGATGIVQVEASQMGDTLYDMAVPVVNSFEVADSSSSIGELESGKIILWPNPVDDVLYLDLSSYPDKTVELAIFDISGKAMRVQKLRSPDENSIRIDVSDLPEGSYFLSINHQGSIQFYRRSK